MENVSDNALASGEWTNGPKILYIIGMKATFIGACRHERGDTYTPWSVITDNGV